MSALYSPSMTYGLVELPPITGPVEPVIPPNYTVDEHSPYGGLDGEEFMGTGTAFDTSEQPPVYTPYGS